MTTAKILGVPHRVGAADLLSCRDAARLLGVASSTIRNRLRRAVPDGARLVGGRWLLTPAAVEALRLRPVRGRPRRAPAPST